MCFSLRGEFGVRWQGGEGEGGQEKADRSPRFDRLYICFNLVAHML